MGRQQARVRDHRPLTPHFWRTKYDEASRRRPGRASISYDDVAAVLTRPIRTEPQPGGRVRYWGFVPARGRCLRVVTPSDGQTVLNAFWDRRLRPMKEPLLHPPETDTHLLEIRPWPAASAAAINAKVGGEDAEEGLVIHFAPDGQPHAYEIEHASARPELFARALNALRAAKGYVAA